MQHVQPVSASFSVEANYGFGITNSVQTQQLKFLREIYWGGQCNSNDTKFYSNYYRKEELGDNIFMRETKVYYEHFLGNVAT
jgi:hypothetical protein